MSEPGEQSSNARLESESTNNNVIYINKNKQNDDGIMIPNFARVVSTPTTRPPHLWRFFYTTSYTK